eukprot:maker-scaffold30_size591359-snap-gene-1.17 protein:Tk12750 transcript:maker-scaffold30_size591359-snap-gene-1.17-mRNA-1 annotation:"hypothetical protein DAPPUDRAFT_50141"
MSVHGFDENPFASPKPNQPDPFQDPSVQQATASWVDMSTTSATNLDDYNPFDGRDQSTEGQKGSSPAVMNPSAQLKTSDDPPPYSDVNQQKITTADFQRRQEELEERARDLERREAELRNAPFNARANNWPPLPKICPIQPCFYQDINVDIPVEFQKIVNYFYYLWVAHVGLLFANMIVGLLYLFVGGDWGGTFMVATIYFIIFSPLSFVCWFRPIYKAFRDDSSFNFMMFFFVFFFQFLMSIVNFLGVGDTGSCGLITGIKEITGSTSSGGEIFVGVLMLITAIGFAVCAISDFYLLTRVHRLYKVSDCNMAKAQAEFASGVMKNETVQRAAADAARESARSAFSQNSAAPNGAGGANRY